MNLLVWYMCKKDFQLLENALKPHSMYQAILSWRRRFHTDMK